jgi:hypothetical protein
MRRYRNRPMSLADACLVGLSEIQAAGEVLALDSDFRIYRRHGNKRYRCGCRTDGGCDWPSRIPVPDGETSEMRVIVPNRGYPRVHS